MGTCSIRTINVYYLRLDSMRVQATRILSKRSSSTLEERRSGSKRRHCGNCDPQGDLGNLAKACKILLLVRARPESDGAMTNSKTVIAKYDD